MKISNATYLSPSLRYDAKAQVVIFERVNPNTGDIIFQVPSRATLRDEAQAAALGLDHPAATAAAGPATATPAATAPAAPAAPGDAPAPRISILV
jgi:hypothetical protein